MKNIFYFRINIAVVILFFSVIITACGPSAEKKEKMKAECAKTAIESAETCKKCCEKAGYTGSSWMSGFMTGGKATCECM